MIISSERKPASYYWANVGCCTLVPAGMGGGGALGFLVSDFTGIPPVGFIVFLLGMTAGIVGYAYCMGAVVKYEK